MPRRIIDILEDIAVWARKYPELYEVGDARNTIANRLAELFRELDDTRVLQNQFIS